MDKSKEVAALFSLIDDPDEEVFVTVSEKIIGYGKNIIPNLEQLWETIPNEGIQQRIEQLIHRLHYRDLIEEFKQWHLSDQQELFTGALLVAKYEFPDISEEKIVSKIESIKRTIWLELNNYLTPLEQLNIVTSILFNYYKLKSNDNEFCAPQNIFISKILGSKIGVQLSNGILILILSELLDIPVKAIQLPEQTVLAYVKPENVSLHDSDFQNKFDFYLDPLGGTIFTNQHLTDYFKRLNIEIDSSYFAIADNAIIIRRLLLELADCYQKENNKSKQKELEDLANLLS
ncbi:MAG: hypothetical protein EPO57_07840 [Chitinophagaceae bacterium]|nr:MAG: hypothetical protein EPO57_07840 [Chitinophagaceae bacterium]